MIWASALLVFATVAVILGNLGAEDGELRLGFEQMIHARVPWLLLSLLWGGAALGLVAVIRERRWYRYGIVALASWCFLSYSYLPDHALALEMGDPFPAYELIDQDGTLRRHDPTGPREPALYIFYRGDW